MRTHTMHDANNRHATRSIAHYEQVMQDAGYGPIEARKYAARIKRGVRRVNATCPACGNYARAYDNPNYCTRCGWKL